MMVQSGEVRRQFQEHVAEVNIIIIVIINILSSSLYYYNHNNNYIIIISLFYHILTSLTSLSLS